jgi:gluconate 2-dehydrogenase gamma chain
MKRIRRRDVLLTAALLLGKTVAAKAAAIAGGLPWKPNAGAPPPPPQTQPGHWSFFNEAEGLATEAIADRLIPPDPQTPGGKDAGCAVYIDAQLAGGYGRQDGLYVRGPFQKAAKQQGPQSEAGPAEQYRKGLAALDRYCRERYGGNPFHQLADTDKDDVLTGLEKGEITLTDADGKSFFELILKDVQQGFFADPIYGGNRDMVAWRMIGYPGARYNYLDWVGRHNERFPLPPVSIAGRPDWTPKNG